MELIPNKPPAAMTTHELFRRLTVVLEKTTREERREFKQAWLDSLADFNERTEAIRFENWKRME